MFKSIDERIVEQFGLFTKPSEQKQDYKFYARILSGLFAESFNFLAEVMSESELEDFQQKIPMDQPELLFLNTYNSIIQDLYYKDPKLLAKLEKRLHRYLDSLVSASFQSNTES